MESECAGKRIRALWRWPSLWRLLLLAAGITVLISLFEIHLDPVAMLQEIAGNFIISTSVTFISATILAAVGVSQLGADWRRSILVLVLLPLGGALGGLLSWGINRQILPFHISHPKIYLLIVGALALVFGVAILAYQTVSEKLADAVAKLAAKDVREQKLLRLKTEAELEALRTKVNPHFLFNTLNSIASLIPAAPDRAEKTVQRLSSLLRYILAAGDRQLVPLDEELEIVAEYLEIEKERLGDRLAYSVERGEGLERTTIPAMLLQPLVENSVKYAVMPKVDGGRVAIRSRREGDRCVLVIEDSGQGFDLDAVREGFGIRGVRQRLELTYPGAHEFELSTGRGVTIRIGIPITDGA